MDRLETALFDCFGYSEFRAGQKEIINSIVEGKDTLAIRPTGSGKSICFQLPSLFANGLTIVVSPLIALMQDQVDNINNSSFPQRATFINSTLEADEVRQRMDDARNGLYGFLYVAPERLVQPRFIDWMKTIDITYLVVDEAHCVVQWGDDFRFAYSKIGAVRQTLEQNKGRPVQIVAFTATASGQDAKAISESIGMSNPQIFLGDYARKNLVFSVEQYGTAARKRDALMDMLDHEPTIIYCSSIRAVGEVGEIVASLNIPFMLYHGQLSKTSREAAQKAFIQSEVNLIICTNAFGMGVDKPDVRKVIHYGVTGCLEDYQQESGRAGRDGLTSECKLIYTRQDITVRKLLLSSRFPDMPIFTSLLNFFSELPVAPEVITFTIGDLRPYSVDDLSPDLLNSALEHLQRQNIIKFKFNYHDKSYTGKLNPARPEFGYDTIGILKSKANYMLSTVVNYVEGTECRQMMMVRYFNPGSENKECGTCDNCVRTERARQLASQSKEEGANKHQLRDYEIDALHLLKRTKGRFGKAKIIKTLSGIADEGVRISKLHKYPEFGACQRAGENATNAIKDLMSMGLVRMTTEPKFPALALSESGYSALKREVGVDIALSNSNEIPVPVNNNAVTQVDAEETILMSAHDKKSLELLNDLRSQIANDYRIDPRLAWTDEQAVRLLLAYAQHGFSSIEVELGPLKGVRYGARIDDLLGSIYKLN